MRFKWTFDDNTQSLRAPSGVTITVSEIAQMLADRRDCRYDFAGAWAGWKMRGNKLIPPFSGKAGPKLTPETTRLFLTWVNEPSRDYAPRKATGGRPALRLVHTSNR